MGVCSETFSAGASGLVKNVHRMYNIVNVISLSKCTDIESVLRMYVIELFYFKKVTSEIQLSPENIITQITSC